MKKFVNIILGIVIIAGVALCGAKFVTQGSSSQTAAAVDAINPLVHDEVSYIKTTKPVGHDEYQAPIYRQKAIDRYGNSKVLEFTGMKTFKQGHYLAIKHKGAFVQTYYEVAKNKVPVAARAELK